MLSLLLCVPYLLSIFRHLHLQLFYLCNMGSGQRRQRGRLLFEAISDIVNSPLINLPPCHHLLQLLGCLFSAGVSWA